jgi:uncharacterized protein YndB with AHSA1/START domain
MSVRHGRTPNWLSGCGQAWEGDTTPGPKPGLVEVTFTPDGDGTLVRLIHRGVAPENQQHSAAGWAHYLDRLARAATGQDPVPTRGRSR